MKKHKILILSILLLMICGCDVKYNINITGSKITEEIILPNDNNYQKEDLENKFYYNVNENKKYELELKKDKIVLTNTKTTLDTLSNNNLYNSCFSKIDSYEKEGLYYIATSTDFSCMYYEYQPIDNITISIKTYNKVKESNADKIGFNTYTWVFNKDNYIDKNIYIVINKNEYVWYYRLRGLIIGLSIILVLVLIVSIIIKIFENRSNKENKI